MRKNGRFSLRGKAVMISCLAFLLIPASFAFASPNKPFPQHTTYTSGTIKPNNVSQSAMDSAVQSKWNSWKAAYLKPAGTGKYYVKYDSNGDTVSEAHGYGMLATVLMAGYDSNAQTYFDGLYKYYKEHPSDNNPYLMAWKQNSSFQNIEGADSATDGDMDIAYSLLLADKQWGSSGSINYLQAAKNIINAIMESDVNQTQWTLRLGDWATDSKYKDATRPSDFMLNHMKLSRPQPGIRDGTTSSTKPTRSSTRFTTTTARRRACSRISWCCRAGRTSLLRPISWKAPMTGTTNTIPAARHGGLRPTT
ncbi:Endoglucanase precursor [Paenibacillus sp. P1XP2]|nr:Endoglucanase precursor [Paenibacillus sp. P1XP2]